MARILAIVCAWMGGGIGWWFGSMVATWLGWILAVLGFAAGTYAGLEIVRRMRP